DRPKFAEVRGAHQRSGSRCQVDLRQEMQGVGIDDRGNRAARERRLQKVRARPAWLPAQARTDHYRVSPVEDFRDWWLELVAKRGFDGQQIGEAGLRRGDRLARSNELDETSAGGKSGTGGVECGAAHPVGAADDADAAAIAFVHLW